MVSLPTVSREIQLARSEKGIFRIREIVFTETERKQREIHEFMRLG